ncbi:cyclase family protein [uncultured Pseudoramibacter sp.]|uniref:cyclase family protein n=1 Tax=uncultured Pseudoramibacter sp. TaxID=1623493 RepID=UPI0025E56DB1|nr:cyclase family protein [uncultured Pseudoramibacter sp.]
MLYFLSHLLDPQDRTWPGEPRAVISQVTEITDDFPYCTYETILPNHFGTHMDGPRHFVKDGKRINDLPIDYFYHKDVALLEIPKDLDEGIHREDLEPFANTLSKVSFVLIRTGIEKYRSTDPDMYQNHGSWIAPNAGDYLKTFPNIKGIGFDFLAIGSPSDKCPPDESPQDCHQHILGFYDGKFIPGIEDMHLSELPKNPKIIRFINAPYRIKDVDSSQVTCICEVE